MIDQWRIILSPWLATYLLHSTLLLGSAWLAVTCFKRLSDEIKEILWTTALVGGVVTATLQVSLNLSPLAGSMNIAQQGRAALSDSLHPPDVTAPQAQSDFEAAAASDAVQDAWFTMHSHADTPQEMPPDEPPAPADAAVAAKSPPAAPPELAALQPTGDEAPASRSHAAASSVVHAL